MSTEERPGADEAPKEAERTGEEAGEASTRAEEGEEGTEQTGREESSSASAEKPSLEEASPLFRPGGGVRWLYLAWAMGSLVAVSVFIWLLMAVQTVSVPFLIAFILAYILDPVVDRFEARGISRTVAICIILSVGLIALALTVLLIGPQLGREFSAVPDKLRDLGSQVFPWVEQRFGLTVPRTIEGAFVSIQEWLGGLDMSRFTEPTVGVLRAVMGGTANVLAIVVMILMVPVFAFFLLRDFDRIVEAARDLVPSRYRASVVDRFREIDRAMSGFIRGQLTVAGILAVLYSVGLWAVGLPMALMVGIVSGLGNMVPYLGTAVGLILATMMALLDWQGIGHLLLVYAVFAAVQALESWLITPRIVGDSVGLSPFLVIVAVLVFGELFGFVGILIAVPLAAILKILLRVLVAEYRASPFFRT